MTVVLLLLLPLLTATACRLVPRALVGRVQASGSVLTLAFALIAGAEVAVGGPIALGPIYLDALGAGDAALAWRPVAAVAPRRDPDLVRLGFLFVIVGFGTKAGFAPLHTWLPDAHSQAPTPVSAVLSGVLLPCALYGIVRTHAIAVGALGPGYSSTLLIAFGVLSAAVAVPFILLQHDLKRLLAYPSIEPIRI